ncbi:MAG TPA: DUF3313 domain-containing protein [Phenylobacterium sp.]
MALAACATPTEQSGMLSAYEGLQPREGTLRAEIAERRDDAGLALVREVSISPVELAPGEAVSWLADAERILLLREMEAQLCFEMSERYEIAAPGASSDARVRTIVTAVKPTGRVGSALSAASNFFIPGPIGVRVPGALGGLAAEAEMLDRSNRQLAALTWSRSATVVGADSPSLSRVGDALQFAEPFADAAAEVMTAQGVKSRRISRPDPCAAYGPRIRPEGFLAKFATGLYVPQMSGARPAAQAVANE